MKNQYIETATIFDQDKDRYVSDSRTVSYVDFLKKSIPAGIIYHSLRHLLTLENYSFYDNVCSKFRSRLPQLLLSYSAKCTQSCLFVSTIIIV